MRFQISTSTQRGLCSYQQDRFTVLRKKAGILLGVMDGHGDEVDVAEYASRELPRVWQSLPRIGIKMKVTSSVSQINHATRQSLSGSTLSMVWVPSRGKNAYVGVLGDSPVAIRKCDGTIWVGPEHNAISNKQEREAAMARGASFDGTYLRRGDFGLQMSRSLGDAELDSILDRTPEVAVVPIDRGSTIIVASDGMFYPSHTTDRVADFSILFEMLDQGGDASTIVENAVDRRTRDNVTAIVCKIS